MTGQGSEEVGMDRRDERVEAPADVAEISASSHGAATNGYGRPEVNYSLQRFSETRAAHAINVPALRRAVVAFADVQGATPMALGSIGQAVGEALNRIVIRVARDDLAPGSMTVAAHRELAHLAVAVIDELPVIAADTPARPDTIVLMGFALS
jgi:hypothetical protein